jgi:prepilin-type N-terminal cleavage/methylation domain-containing protein
LTPGNPGIKTGESFEDTLNINKKGVNPVKKGFTLIELLIVVAIIAILAAIAVPNFLEAQVRAKVSRCKSDLRSMATAIESYYVDNNTYPVSGAAASPTANTNYNAALSATQDPGNTGQLTRAGQVFTFGARTGSGSQAFATVTTPIGYVTSYFVDPFANFRSATINYKTNTAASNWILGCNGPDLTAEGLFAHDGTSRIAKQTPPNETSFDLTPSVLSAAYEYDPTNGTISNGDVIRPKQ